MLKLKPGITGSDWDQKIDTLVKSLETYASEEIQGLRETMIKRFEMMEEIIGAVEQSNKAQGQNTTSQSAVRTGLPRVLVSYPVIYSDKVPTSKGSKKSQRRQMDANRNE